MLQRDPKNMPHAHETFQNFRDMIVQDHKTDGIDIFIEPDIHRPDKAVRLILRNRALYLERLKKEVGLGDQAILSEPGEELVLTGIPVAELLSKAPKILECAYQMVLNKKPSVDADTV